LEGIAKPGGICLSEQACWQVKSRLDLTASNLGAIQLKNIAEPVRVYSHEVGKAAQAKPTKPTASSSIPVLLGTGIVVLSWFHSAQGSTPRSRLPQRVEQRLCVLQIARIESLSEPAVDRSEKLASLIPFSLIAPETRHAHRCAQFPGLCLLRTRNRERTLEMRLGLGRVWLWRLERDFSRIDLSLKPPFPGCFYRTHRLANAEALAAPLGDRVQRRVLQKLRAAPFHPSVRGVPAIGHEIPRGGIFPIPARRRS
jgi:hypothetical protein